MKTVLTEKQLQLINAIGNKNNLKRVLKSLPEKEFQKLNNHMTLALKECIEDKEIELAKRERYLQLIQKNEETLVTEEGIPRELFVEHYSQS